MTWDGHGIASLDAACLQLDGSAAVTAAGDPWSVLIASYNRCADGCPMSGGSLILSRATGTQTRVEFSGGNSVSVTAATGRAAAATVPCGG